MRISKSNKVELIASRDECRPHLLHTHLDVEKKRLCATDGHRLVILPVVVEDGDVSGAVSTEAIKAARKGPEARGGGGEIVIGANGKLAIAGGPSYPRPSEVDCKFPPVDRVVPDAKNHTVTIGLNAKYLWELAQALGTVEIHIAINPDEELSPIRVTKNGNESDGIGVLMPCKV